MQPVEFVAWMRDTTKRFESDFIASAECDASYYYSKGIATGLAVAIEIAEECETIAEFVNKTRRRIQVGRE